MSNDVPATKTSRKVRTDFRRAKVHERAAQPASMRLEERDTHVLEALATHRFLSGEQLHRLLFQCGSSMARRRLRLLYDHRLIDRLAIMGQPSRGVPPFVYTLGRNGRLALAELGITAGVEGAPHPDIRHVRHRYLLNDFYVSLMEASRETPYGVRGWLAEDALLLRRGEGRGVAEQVTHPRLGRPASFLPDAFFELDLGSNQSLAFFFELDLATNAQRIWRHRARLYTIYADPALGLFSRRFGRQSFRLLIVTTADYRGRSRRDNILASIHQEVGATDLFLATTLPEIQTQGALAPIWRRADGTRQTVSLLPPVRVTTPRPREQASNSRVHIRPQNR